MSNRLGDWNQRPQTCPGTKHLHHQDGAECQFVYMKSSRDTTRASVQNSRFAKYGYAAVLSTAEATQEHPVRGHMSAPLIIRAEHLPTTLCTLCVQNSLVVFIIRNVKRICI